MTTEFQCFRRIGKSDHLGTLSVNSAQLVFTAASAASCENAMDGDPSGLDRVSRSYLMNNYSAQRTHPKLPMVQLRFTQPDALGPPSAASSPEEATFVFRDPTTGQPDVNSLQRFIAVVRLVTTTSVVQPSIAGPAGGQQRGVNEPVEPPRSAPLSTSSVPVPPPSLPVLIPPQHLQQHQQTAEIRDHQLHRNHPHGSLIPQEVSSSSIYRPSPHSHHPHHHHHPETSQSRSLTSQTLAAVQQERCRLLDEDEELKSAYDYLVTGKFLTDNQFWEQHEEEFLSFQSQPVGSLLEDCFLGKPPVLSTAVLKLKNENKEPSHSTLELPKSSTKKTSIPSQITEQQLHQIMAEHPPVKQLYATTVPTQFTHDEFWSWFFQSRYYYQMIGAVPPPGAEEVLFPDFDPQDLLKVPTAVEVQRLVDPTVDLVDTEQFNRSGLLSSAPAPRRSNKRLLLDRLNINSLKFVNASLHQPGQRLHLRQHKKSSREKQPLDISEKRKRVFHDNLLMEDLERSQTRTDPILHLATVNRPQRQESGRQGMTDASGVDADLHDDFVKRLKLGAPAVAAVPPLLPSEEAKFMFALNTRLIQKELQKQDDRKVQELLQHNQIQDLLQRVAVHQSRLRELLQHFWQTEVFQNDKLERLTTAIKHTMVDLKASMNRLGSSADRQTSVINSRALFQPLLEACKTAMNCYGALIKQSSASMGRKQPLGIKRHHVHVAHSSQDAEPPAERLRLSHVTQ